MPQAILDIAGLLLLAALGIALFYLAVIPFALGLEFFARLCGSNLNRPPQYNSKPHEPSSQTLTPLNFPASKLYHFINSLFSRRRP